jgi:hypothetical protein
MKRYMKTFIENLRSAKGDRFIQELYDALKEEYQLKEAQLPPDPNRTRQLRPEHDIRSRAPGLHKNEKPVEDTGFYGCQIRYKP